MSVVAFDTHKFVKRLQEAGFSEAQAEAVTLAVQEAASIDLTALATKLDIADLQRATKQDFADLQRATKQDIVDLQRATKQDIADLQRATQQDASDLRRDAKQDVIELRRDLAETKVEILKWLIGLIGFQTIAVLGGVAALIKLIH